MRKNIEIETKAKLTKEEYGRIISSVAHPRFQYQTNFYIDTPNFELSEHHLGLRIRQEKDFLELTMKVPHEEGKLEINQRLSPKEFDNFLFSNNFPSGEIKRYLQEFYPRIAGKLSIFGTLHNQRLTIELEDAEIMVDHMSYFDQEDYEIECESSSMDNAEKVIKNYLSNFDIKYQKNQVTKLQRVINLVR